MKILENKSISHVNGFQAVGLHAGIKRSNKKDLCLIYSSVPAVAAATFTTNVVKAAPVILDMEHIKSPTTRALIINSGNANACTGDEGYENAVAMAIVTAQCLGISPLEVLVYSTGIIGLQLPIDKITKGIEKASTSLINDDSDFSAEAIITTDTFSKSICVEIELSGSKVTIAGIAKGSGMIHPNMATMLSYIVTDANISKKMLNDIHKESVETTYNMISVDGDTSTNDTATIIANGTANNPLIDSKNDDYHIFKDALNFVNQELAKMIAKDGEGATKLIEAVVKGARSLDDARKCAKSVISSSLVKTAIFGSDVNWGRVLCAMGYSGGKFNPSKVDLSFSSINGDIQVFNQGIPLEIDEDLAFNILDTDSITINIHLNDGTYEARAWGCDLSYEYVRINGEYRS